MTTTPVSPLMDMTNEDYHSRDALSSTGAVAILKSPARFKYDRENKVYKKEYDFGHVAHALILGDDTTEIAVLDFPDRRTKAYKEAEAEARANGQVPVLASVYEKAEDMAAEAAKHPRVQQLISAPGEVEKSAFWADEATGIECRARFDKLVRLDDQLVIVDYKTSVSADPDDFAKTAASYGYHQQAAWYIEAIQTIGLHAEPAFIHIVQEKEPPYLTSAIQLDAEALDTGAWLNDIARETFAACQKTGDWPGYPTGIHQVSLPGWYLAHLERKHP